MLLFRITMLLKLPALPATVPSETNTPELELIPLIRIVFFTVQFNSGALPIDPRRRIFGVVRMYWKQ